MAIYSPADRLQSHRYNADESYCVGTTDMQPVSCYLDIESIIKVAKEAEVDAIHPGYGFLSENTTFARRCEEEGIAFIGPKAETIEVSLHTHTHSHHAELEQSCIYVCGPLGSKRGMRCTWAAARHMGFRGCDSRTSWVCYSSAIGCCMRYGKSLFLGFRANCRVTVCQ